jgi:hypothetical protein
VCVGNFTKVVHVCADRHEVVCNGQNFEKHWSKRAFTPATFCVDQVFWIVWNSFQLHKVIHRSKYVCHTKFLLSVGRRHFVFCNSRMRVRCDAVSRTELLLNVNVQLATGRKTLTVPSTLRSPDLQNSEFPPYVIRSVNHLTIQFNSFQFRSLCCGLVDSRMAN